MDVGGFLGYDAVQSAIDSIALKITETQLGKAVIWAKGLAVAFVVLNFMKEMLKNLKSDMGGQIFSFYSAAMTLFFIFILWNTESVLGLADACLQEFSNLFKNMPGADNSMDGTFSRWCQEYEEAYTEYKRQNESSVPLIGDVYTILLSIFDLFNSAFYFIILVVIKGLAWVINGLAYPVFLIERGFLLIIMKITAPLLFALAVMEKHRDLVWRWLKIYAAIFLTGLFFILVTWFTDLLFVTLSRQFLDNAYAGQTQTAFGIETGFMDRHLIQVCFYSAIVFSKVKLYATSISIANRLFA